jgi:peptidoglycan LD-endopeptidase LytH
MMAAAALLALIAIPMFAGTAIGGDSLADLKARMQEIRADLNASTQRVEDLHAREERVETRITEIEDRIEQIEEDNADLMQDAERRAVALYKAGNVELVGVLFGSKDIGELSDRVTMLAQISEGDNSVFVKLERVNDELGSLRKELALQKADLAATEKSLQREADALRDSLRSVSDEYEELKRKLAAAAAAEDSAPTPLEVTDRVVVPAVGGMACPVAGPVSFVDSWGSPRSGGRSHEGVDMMADYGTPVVAITAGTIGGAGYHSLGGNMLYLTANNGDVYYYAHNQTNMVTSGRVSAGEQIATVGDTGNASGVPHLHFEYHPGGGGAVNPYPLVASIC